MLFSTNRVNTEAEFSTVPAGVQVLLRTKMPFCDDIRTQLLSWEQAGWLHAWLGLELAKHTTTTEVPHVHS